MASPSDTIVIVDDEIFQSFEPGDSRPRRGPRRDYRYRDFESMIIESNADEVDTTPSRKRKRTESKELSMDNAFEELRKAVDREIQLLEEKKRMLQDQLHLEREAHKQTQGMLSKEKERLIECMICYMQPDHWVTILCGHMVCESCAGNLEMPKSCPICRVPFTGYVRCYPFAG
ncbi:unnamed protein product [Penicillium nalgiovense]|nr:unnamed protein product [Penicillium nalgiovense]CAG8209940.1 unnamed protein product [Penicillium nalgiovense]CAG8300893.1 unnamed protein product [Penicillium nalgiovense]